jgi:hypothetical protein
MPYVFTVKKAGGERLWRCCVNTTGKAPGCGGCTRCVAYRAGNRERCKLKTCYGNYCHVHLRKPYYEKKNSVDKTIIGLRIKDSTIAAAGRGLFATRDMEKGENIMQFDFEKLNGADMRARYDYDDTEGTAPYGFKISGMQDTYGDAACLRNPPSFANDPKNKKKVNAIFKPYDVRGRTQVWLQTRKTIKAGAEIFVDYGADYWKKMDNITYDLKTVRKAAKPRGKKVTVVRG